MAFVKLHGTILDSSIWSESHPTRIVWITLLAMADQDGVVQASMDGLAHRARVSIVEAQEAIGSFLGPDAHSRDGTTGERVEKIPGGWLVLNHANYRDQRTKEQIATAARVARHRAKQKRPVTKRYNTKVTPGNANSPSEAEAEAESPTEMSTSPPEKKRAPRAPPAALTEGIDHWSSEWHRTRGSDCLIQAGDRIEIGKLIKLAEGNVLEVKHRMTNALERTEQFWLTSASPYFVRRNWNQLALVVKGPRMVSITDQNLANLEEAKRIVASRKGREALNT